MNIAKCIVFAGFVALTAASGLGYAQDKTPPPPSLKDLLLQQYKLTVIGNDSQGVQILEPGTVFTMKKGGLRGFKEGTKDACPGTFQDGNLAKESSACTFGAKAEKIFKHFPSGGGGNTQTATDAMTNKFFTVGQKVVMTKLDVNESANKITVNFIECDKCNGVTTPSSMAATVTFLFAKDFLKTAEPTQITDAMNLLLEPDPDTTKALASGTLPAGGQQAQATPDPTPAPVTPPPPPPPPPATAVAPPTVQVGDTPEKVISIMGQPVHKLAGAGGKQIYIYSDVKVIFIGGKVSDVQ